MDVQGRSFNPQSDLSLPSTSMRPKRMAPTRADALAGKTVDPIKNTSDTTQASAAKAASTFKICAEDIQFFDQVLTEAGKLFDVEESPAKDIPLTAPEKKRADSAPERTPVQLSKAEIKEPSKKEATVKSNPLSMDLDKVITKARATTGSEVKASAATGSETRARFPSIRERAKTALDSLKRSFSPDRMRTRNESIRQVFAKGVEKVKTLFQRIRASTQPKTKSVETPKVETPKPEKKPVEKPILEASTPTPTSADVPKKSSVLETFAHSYKIPSGHKETSQDALTLAKVKELENKLFVELSETDTALVSHSLEEEFNDLSKELLHINSFKGEDDEYSSSLLAGTFDNQPVEDKSIERKLSLKEKLDTKLEKLKTTFKEFHSSNVKKTSTTNSKIAASMKTLFRKRAITK